MDLLAIAHEGDPPGHVTINGRPPTTRQLSVIVGVSEREMTRLLGELEDAGVFSRTEDGTIYSRRMVRDHAKSLEGQKHIKKRWDGADPTRGPDSPPNRAPNRPPNTLEAEAEAEAEVTPSVSPPAEPKPPRSPKGSRLTDGFEPDYAFARSLGLDAVAVHAAFRDYWRAKPGQAGVKLDWQATWRNWCRREAERKPGAGPPRRQHDTAADRMRALFPDPPRDPRDDEAIEVPTWHEN